MGVVGAEGASRERAPFGALMYEPANNIYVLPNDVIFVFSLPQTFVAFGATGTQGQFKFEAWHILLGEPVAKQGGLNDGIQARCSSIAARPGKSPGRSELMSISSTGRSSSSSA
jgi:polysaccharide export outer membrane protein